jgi:hypothetical protein
VRGFLWGRGPVRSVRVRGDALCIIMNIRGGEMVWGAGRWRILDFGMGTGNGDREQGVRK